MIRGRKLGKEFFYDWLIIRSKGNVIEYTIYSYLLDGSFNDIEETVILNKKESIREYIEKKYK